MSSDESAKGERRRRSPFFHAALGALTLALFSGFVALGVWQVERRAWKLDLIARVEARIHAAPVAAPGPDRWAELSASDEYRRVRLVGRFDHARETFTQATTAYGAGYWTLTPLRTHEGFDVLVNRGFVTSERRDPASRGAAAPEGETEVVGLMRLSEPHGGFLRANDPAADLWRSRDVAAIAAARGLTRPAPYFVDAEAGPDRAGWPKAGLTVVAFRNDHLVYALTWFGLAAMTLAGAAIVILRGRSGARDA
ncbi:surfeit locus 1 family protein [Methylopila jiangsuensis]|uniref:SURF1 family protein n=1 Tax=Methylopila jiangsuensis TaxID=586230 RepID=UPI0028670540|nr:surfeit locus 1 family protein [Methylopila jiangsuensis]